MFFLQIKKSHTVLEIYVTVFSPEEFLIQIRNICTDPYHSIDKAKHFKNPGLNSFVTSLARVKTDINLPGTYSTVSNKQKYL
jgi:hypothetical protein